DKNGDGEVSFEE
nr:Chain A, Vitamin D-dependent calcium-binding protein, intestinal [synthetic construct]1RSX_A Chain A, Vitamin D-dependent calcium-binding protein, intestinal [synthetic construct]1RT0_A Chain A, Vitamin D-dependent calcium-binding protein, intestinal [synthetic construct]